MLSVKVLSPGGRRISHVKNADLAYVAASWALACAGVAAPDVDMIAYATAMGDEVVPNTASILQTQMGIANAACLDVIQKAGISIEDIDRITPLGRTDANLPSTDKTCLGLINEAIDARKDVSP